MWGLLCAKFSSDSSKVRGLESINTGEGEALVQVGEDVADRLEADAEAHEAALLASFSDEEVIELAQKTCAG